MSPENKITFNDIFIKAVGRASTKFPQARSQWYGDFIRTFEQVDVAFAVDTGDGLITPIVPNVPRLRLSKLSGLSKELISKARNNKLAPQEYQVKAIFHRKSSFFPHSLKIFLKFFASSLNLTFK